MYTKIIFFGSYSHVFSPLKAIAQRTKISLKTSQNKILPPSRFRITKLLKVVRYPNTACLKRRISNVPYRMCSTNIRVLDGTLTAVSMPRQ